MKLPTPLRRRLAWLSQATFTVGVSAVLVNDRNEILLLRHRFRDNQNWELPGGFVEREENLVEALQRELSEETGLAIEVHSLISANVSTARHLDVCYLARVAGGTLRIDDREVLEAGFYAFQDLPPGLRVAQRRNIEPARVRLEHPTVRPG